MAALDRRVREDRRCVDPRCSPIRSAQLDELLRGPEEPIAIRLEVVGPTQAARLDGFQARQPTGLVPVVRRVWDRNESATILAQSIRVRLDQLEQLLVSLRPGELDDGAGGHLRELRALLEATMLASVDQLEDVDARVGAGATYRSASPPHRSSRCRPACKRHAVVTVTDEVEAAGFVGANRGIGRSPNASFMESRRLRSSRRRGRKNWSKSTDRSTDPTMSAIGISRIRRSAHRRREDGR